MDERLMLQKIISLYTDSGESLNSACKQSAKELNPPRWTWNYLKKLVGENPPNPGDDLRGAIRVLYREKFHKSRPKSYSVKVSAANKEEKRKWLEMIPMERRQELFRAELERLEKQVPKTPRILWVERLFRRKMDDHSAGD